MFRINTKKILLKVPTIYDYQPPIPQEVRVAVIKKLMFQHPNLQIKGGDSVTNPYKIPYELAIADRREAMEKYKNSVLWSPRFTPWHFKYTFAYPALFVAILMWYITYVSIPQRIVYLRQKYGYICQDLVDRGWMDGWLDEEDDETRDQQMGFDPRTMQFQDTTEQKVMEKKYTDFTLQDLQNFENKSIYVDQSQQGSLQQPQNVKDPKMSNYKNKMQKRLEKIYQLNSADKK